MLDLSNHRIRVAVQVAMALLRHNMDGLVPLNTDPLVPDATVPRLLSIQLVLQVVMVELAPWDTLQELRVPDQGQMDTAPTPNNHSSNSCIINNSIILVIIVLHPINVHNKLDCRVV